MAPTLPPELGAIITRLVSALAPDQIVLFGSYARGGAKPGSDIDLLVVAPHMGEPTGELRRARQLMAGSFPPVDLQLCTPSDVAADGDRQPPFLRSILESGTTVYQRGGKTRAQADATTEETI